MNHAVTMASARNPKRINNLDLNAEVLAERRQGAVQDDMDANYYQPEMVRI
ncbi:hypothetical protein [Steroidobacter gossypii]|uniref:hypothetical protein n=1 Tax=Steroidobacter gossypii TaxID=2805490 RepID=UPI001C3F9C87|nr:hypothetical protein [Steroidobacter gossypii]